MSAAVVQPVTEESCTSPTEEERKLFDDIEATVSENRAAAGGLRFNSDELKEQRKICLEFIRTLGTQFLSGGDVIHTSLPVRLFEPRSFLERMTEFWGYNDILRKASKTADPVERLKWLVAFTVSGLHRDIYMQKKPFNPLLGETYQATFSDGTQIFCEQTSHHPPISSFYLVGPENVYELSGSMKLGAAVRGNMVKITHEGTHTLKLPDGAKITWGLPSFSVHGIFYGERIANVCGRMVLTDEQNGLTCIVRFNPNEKGFFSQLFSWQQDKTTPSDFFEAKIYRHDKNTPAEKGEIIAEGEGSWLDKVLFKGEVLWDIKDTHPSHPIPLDHPLPSDSRFREDLITLIKGDFDEAQKAKVRVEEKQREEARFRKMGKTAPVARSSSLRRLLGGGN
mmetsp:Transcript_46488/g.75879  ORF Transcript_46488/g.75879 Transcript_46488/m.75879 type:complete len:395 (+) Transcript_46488:219-1403(+)|eukprot:CAMPEP_0184657350 /NCGR_PEP_ID=MMETSP0308-20130426/19029_1 /TAXON_ID=38269 /ORGANISM="Gloeochaete witrockiana, Strain SAG 46.84" /LENGTH=394 /DNA_ID=CAMNT_0027095091 /DNA_START=130 /DNA_END=1314 /DNA_ORIENTATION=-